MAHFCPTIDASPRLVRKGCHTGVTGNEWMWIEVTAWKGSKITGILQNDPFEISGLKSGAIVTANENDIFDYIYYQPDGSFEGNETGGLMSRGN